MKTIKVGDAEFAQTINKAVRLDKQMKAFKLELDAIKTELDAAEPGKYLTEEGNTLTISESPKFSDVTPDDAKKALREKRLGKNFHECIKVNVTCLKRFLSDQELGILRDVVTYTRRYSFK